MTTANPTLPDIPDMLPEELTDSADRDDPVATGDSGTAAVEDARALIRKLRAENRQRRLAERELRAELETLQTRFSTVAENLRAAFGDEAETPEDLAARARAERDEDRQRSERAAEALLRARFDALAVDRRVAHPDDAFALLDRGAITVDARAMRIEGLDHAFDALLAEKPYLKGVDAPPEYGTDVPSETPATALTNLAERATQSGSNADIVTWWRAQTSV